MSSPTGAMRGLSAPPPSASAIGTVCVSRLVCRDATQLSPARQPNGGPARRFLEGWGPVTAKRLPSPSRSPHAGRCPSRPGQSKFPRLSPAPPLVPDNPAGIVTLPVCTACPPQEGAQRTCPEPGRGKPAEGSPTTPLKNEVGEEKVNRNSGQFKIRTNCLQLNEIPFSNRNKIAFSGNRRFSLPAQRAGRCWGTRARHSGDWRSEMTTQETKAKSAPRGTSLRDNDPARIVTWSGGLLRRGRRRRR
jgi:hypothetical protein